MPADPAPLALRAGQIVLADWRGYALPKEPNKLRPAVVVEDDGLFAPAYPNVILVPLTDDLDLVIPDLSVAIDPTAANGCANVAGQWRIWWRRPRNSGCSRQSRGSRRNNWYASGGPSR